VTCAHVVRAALDLPHGIQPGSKDLLGQVVSIAFDLDSEPDRDQAATVFAAFSDYDDDAVLLKLANTDVIPEGRTPAVLGPATGIRKHHFQSYGYSPTGDAAFWASGDIYGHAEMRGKVLRCRLMQLNSSEIDHGMSGSPVLDEESNLVVGIVSN